MCRTKGNNKQTDKRKRETDFTELVYSLADNKTMSLHGCETEKDF